MPWTVGSPLSRSMRALLAAVTAAGSPLPAWRWISASMPVSSAARCLAVT